MLTGKIYDIQGTRHPDDGIFKGMSSALSLVP